MIDFRPESELITYLNIPKVNCCQSCHDDAERGWPLYDIKVDGKIYQCCCVVRNQIKEKDEDGELMSYGINYWPVGEGR